VFDAVWAHKIERHGESFAGLNDGASAAPSLASIVKSFCYNIAAQGVYDGFKQYQNGEYAMRTTDDLARQNIEIFIEKYPFPRPGWIVSSKSGHQTIRVHELETARTLGRRFDVMITGRTGTVSALYEVEKDDLRPVEISPLERLVARFQRSYFPNTSLR
jgi:hypothetical protein